MGLFDDILGKVSELTSSGQDAIDSASQAAGDLQGQAEEQMTNITEQLPQDPTGITDQLFGNENEK
jgi:hypothetical protein